MTTGTLSKVFFAAVAAASLTGCLDTVSVLQAVPQSQRQALAFSGLEVAFDPALEEKPSLERDALVEEMTRQFTEIADAREKVGVPVETRAQIEILGYKEANAALSLLLADSAEIMGYVRLRDVASDEQIGEYYIDVTYGEADILGVATAAAGEKELSRAFLKEFFKTLDQPGEEAGKAR
ncbi:MAG: hypothetical protein AAF337_03060 [Pseudomonadota bacterium]